MSSPTESNIAAARRAVRRATLARAASWLAAGTGVGLIGLFLYQAGLFSTLMPKLAPPAPHIDSPGQITSIDSVLTGKDNAGNPYEITAKRASQDKDSNTVFHLDTMRGSFHRAASSTYRVVSDTARYDSKAKTADLKGSVQIVEEGRFTARMAEAHVDLAAKSLDADVPVSVVLNHGTIDANGLKITDDGNHVLFLNGVKAHFDNSSAAPGATP